MHHILNMAGLYTFWLLLSWAGLIRLINTAESAPKCSYSVEEIRVAFQLKMTDSTAGKYAINVAEKEGLFKYNYTHSFSNDDSTHQIIPPMSCTEYELNVALISSNGREILCTKSDTKTTTTRLNFIDPNDIKQTGPTKLPAKIEATFPPSCKHLSVEYKCSGKDNTSVEPSDMKPFTDYSCTGLIKNNNVFINKKTPPVHFNIDCDFTIKDLKPSSTNSTSFMLNWETTSDKCQDILHKLKELSYSCSCQEVKRTEVKKSKEPDGGTCDIRGLKAYKDYRCEVRPFYDGRGHFTGQAITIKTKPGKPDKPTRVKEAEPSENKAIRVTCGPPNDFKGPEKKYKAKLLNGPGPERSNTKCDFEFKDLSYSTSYTVEIVTFNGHLRSEPVRMEAASRYNFKARLGVLSFLLLLLIIITAITEIVAFIIRRRASRRNKPGYQHRDKEAH